MARVYDDASSQSHTMPFTLVTGAPVTLTAWVYCDAAAFTGACLGLYDTSAEDHYILIDVLSTLVPRIVIAAGGADAIATGPSDFTINTWHHIAGIKRGAADQQAYVDGVGGTLDTTNITPTGLDTVGIGAEATNTVEAFWSGRLLWPAIYNTDLSDTEIQEGADGRSPLYIRRDALVSFPPLEDDDDFDIISGTALTANNGPTVVNDFPEPFVRTYPRGRASRTRNRLA